MQKTNKQSSLDPEQQTELEMRLLEASDDRRIHCARALGIAKSMGIPAGEVGKAANKLKIRISKCQLGCF